MSLMDRINWDGDPFSDIVVMGVKPLRHIAEQIQLLSEDTNENEKIDALAGLIEDGLMDVEKAIDKANS